MAVIGDLAESPNGRIEPVRSEDVTLAVELAGRLPSAGSRDPVHAAAMRRLGVSRVITADTDFDRLEGVVRLDPARVTEWERTVTAA